MSGGRGGRGAGGGGEDPPAEGLEELLAAFVEAIGQCEAHLNECGFEMSKLVEAEGVGKIALLSKGNEDSAVNAVCETDETRARFEVLAREVFKKRKALIGEPEMTKPYMQRAESTGLPVNAYTDDEVKTLADAVYLHVYQQCEVALGGVPA